MGSDIMIIMIDRVKLLIDEMSWTEIHLGKNPISGGNPIRDIMFKEIRVAFMGFDLM